jgi:transcriptional antiterminator RfaH
MKQWFAVQTHAKGEDKSAFNLKRQGFSVYLPHYLKSRKHARKRDWVKAPLFPRYLFVSLDMELDSWRAIHSTIGVSHLICSGDKPAALPQIVIDEIRDREDEKGLVNPNKFHSFNPGDKVQILEGAFVDHIGIFERITDDERVQVLLEFLSRPINIKVPLHTIDAVS